MFQPTDLTHRRLCCVEYFPPKEDQRFESCWMLEFPQSHAPQDLSAISVKAQQRTSAGVGKRVRIHVPDADTAIP